jgi:DNA-binding winged helix-turn-helix (wHTH) protein/tetratricopeptide (TPR) repeat protein
MQGAQQLLFPPFRVDLSTERLWQGEREILLRPKTFAVLRYLLEQRQTSVTTAALLQAVWPDVIVSEAVPRMCIRELRRVLGDDARQPRFIATQPRRGYRWIAPLAAAPPVADSRPLVTGLQRPPRRPPLVGRETQLAQLHGWLEETRHGARHIVFVTGEPGIGKTALVEAFLAQVASTDGWCIVQGQCVEQYGAGEAYLPILEALERLGRVLGPEQLAGTLRQFAPMWLLQLPSLTRPAERAQLQQQLAGATRHRMLRELAQTLEVLTAEQPLILWLEDLHWSDYSTLDLVSTLARRREAARLLVIGTYRPVNVLLSDHPLHVVKQELQLHGCCQELALGLLTDMDITAYLRARLAEGVNPVPLQHFQHFQHFQHLARLIHQHTDGNPLFMVSLVNDLMERGALVQHAGQWHLRVAPEALALMTPANIRHMIEQQLERLGPEDQRLLEAASVAGVEFSAATVAAGMGRRPETVEEQCARLCRRGQWLQSQGAIEWPDGTIAAGYRFLHAVYQEVLYERVAPGVRAQLHERIGQRLEGAYARHLDDIVVELALHFERGRNGPKAVQYLEHAGKIAVGRSAPREAVQHFTKAIGLLTAWPEAPARWQHELSLQLMRAAALMATRGLAAPEVAYAYARAWELCQQLGEAAQTFAVVTGFFTFHTGRGDVPKGHEFAAQCLRLAERGDDPALLLQAHRGLGSSLFYLGRFLTARRHLEQAVALYDAPHHQGLALQYGQDPGVVAAGFLSWTLWRLGYADQALHRSRAALALARRLAHAHSLAWALHFSAVLHGLCGEWSAVQAGAEELLAVAAEQGLAFWLPLGTFDQGWALVGQGQYAEGIARMRQGITGLRATGSQLGQSGLLRTLAEAVGRLRQSTAGLRILDEAFTVARHNGEAYDEVELWRAKGALTLAQYSAPSLTSHAARGAVQEAEGYFLHAIEMARQQSAKSLELRAVMSLSRLWQSQGRQEESRQILTEIYGWFTEGFDTEDVQEARALLIELGRSVRSGEVQ